MVRAYKRKTERQSWNEISMAKAIQAVVTGESGYWKASDAYNVPRTTLYRRVKLYRPNPDIELATIKGLGRFETVFTENQEKLLVDYIKEMEMRMHGLTGQELRILVYQLAERNGIQHSFVNGMAGKDWLRAFLLRNPSLSIRKPEATPLARAMGFNKVVVDNFQTLLEKIFKNTRLTPDRIFNVDEMGCSTVAKHVPKILGTKGKKQIGIVSSAERGQNVTVEMCASASGQFLPPMFIFPRTRMDEKLMIGAPAGSWSACHPSGWMQSDIFTSWFKWFVKFTKPTENSPVLLLLDGHTTHRKNLDVIDHARKNHVTILCFSPHCTHRLQPLDISVMRPLSIYYATEVKQWLRLNAGRAVKPAQVPELFGKAFAKAAIAETAKSGFRKAGIWPFNRNIFTENDFMAAETTNRSMPCSSLPTTSDSHSFFADDIVQPQKLSTNEGLLDLPSTSSENSQLMNHVETHDMSFDFEPIYDEILEAAEYAEEKSDVQTLTSSDADYLSAREFFSPESYLSTQAIGIRAPTFEAFITEKINRTESISSDDDFVSAIEFLSSLSNQSKADTEILESTLNMRCIDNLLRTLSISPVTVAHDDEVLRDLSQSLSEVSILEEGNMLNDPEPGCSTMVPRKRQRLSHPAFPSLFSSLSSDEENTSIDKNCKKAATYSGRKFNISAARNFTVSPYEIQPLPVAIESENPRRSARGKTAIWTETEYRNELLNAKKGSQRTTKSSKKKKTLAQIDDAPCLFCGKLYSQSTEGWIQCQKCKRWSHESCAGVDPDEQTTFECDFCKSMVNGE